ncbi:MAG: hypothetical protein ABI778_09985 [Ignavibacteriota bacterium]
MKLLKSVSVFIIILLLASQADAQINVSDSSIPKPKHFAENVFGVGLHASLVSGMGISFRHRIASTAVAYQINGGILKLSGKLYYDLGGEFQFDLSGGESDRVYVALGLGYYYKGDATNDLNTPFRIGAGIGYEFPLASQIGCSVAVVVMGFLPGGNILPLPQIGMHYFFK